MSVQQDSYDLDIIFMYLDNIKVTGYLQKIMVYINLTTQIKSRSDSLKQTTSVVSSVVGRGFECRMDQTNLLNIQFVNCCACAHAGYGSKSKKTVRIRNYVYAQGFMSAQTVNNVEKQRVNSLIKHVGLDSANRFYIETTYNHVVLNVHVIFASISYLYY